MKKTENAKPKNPYPKGSPQWLAFNAAFGKIK